MRTLRIDNVDTTLHFGRMMKQPGLAESPAPFDAAPAEKGSINLRIEASTRALIDEAATLLGKTRTEFMIDTARRQAMDVLLDRRLFTLGDAGYDAFVQALDNPPAPGPRLRALMGRKPVWE
jgi:uncharacterized protein (DUF1778 family)